MVSLFDFFFSNYGLIEIFWNYRAYLSMKSYHYSLITSLLQFTSTSPAALNTSGTNFITSAKNIWNRSHFSFYLLIFFIFRAVISLFNTPCSAISPWLSVHTSSSSIESNSAVDCRSSSRARSRRLRQRSIHVCAFPTFSTFSSSAHQPAQFPQIFWVVPGFS